MSRVSSSTLSSPYARTSVMGIVLALLLGGCEYGTTPSEPPSATSTTTASPASGSSVPTPPPTSPAAYKPADAKGKAQNVPVPVMPELAKENTKAGLEAFIGYWFQLLSYAYETGDIAKVKELSRESCALCSDLLSGVSNNYTDGRWLVGGQYATPVIDALWEPNASSQSAKVQVLQQEIRYVNVDGSFGREPTAATNDAAAFFGVFADGAWSTANLGVIR